MASGGLLHMGTLSRPHGVRGEIAVRWHGTASLPPDAPVWLQRGEDAPWPVRVVSLREHKGMLLLCLEGVEDRDAAKALCGSRLLTADSALPPLEEDEVYVRDLLGADVMLPDGSRLGRLDHLLAESGQDVWVIVTDGGEEILFPARPCFIERFDLERGRVHVAPPEGLLDVYLR